MTVFIRWSLLIFLLVGFIKVTIAQESKESEDYSIAFENPNMLFKDGKWVIPTPETALDKLLNADGTEKVFGESWEPLVAVLNQTFRQYSRTELDALAYEVGRIFVESPNFWQVVSASHALVSARRTDVIIDIYEHPSKWNHLRNISPRGIFNMLMRTGTKEGEDYVWKIFNESEKPAICSEDPHGGDWLQNLPNPSVCDLRSLWCQAGSELIGRPGGPLNQEDWDKRCYEPMNPWGPDEGHGLSDTDSEEK